jgi:hypothetical protein
MTEQPVARKLAEVIDALNEADLSLPLEMLPRISTELRRLHKENAGLRLLHKESVEKQPNIYRVEVSRWHEGKGTTYDHPLYFRSKYDAHDYCWTINQDRTKTGTIIAESFDIGLYPSPKELLRLHELNAELLEALEAASEHLDYVGYGDSWERECAHHARLPERIAAAIAKTYPVAAPPENTKAPITGEEKRKQLRRIKKAAITKATGETE